LVKQNILELCLSHGRGGLEFYVAKAIRLLNNRDFRVIACITANSPLDSIIQDDDIEKLYLSCRSRYLPVFAARKLAKMIDQYEIDIVHINWGHDLPLASMAKRYSRSKPQLVYSRHMKITKAKHDVYHRWLYRQVDLFLGVTNQLNREAQEFLPLAKEKIRTCYLGVADPPAGETDCSRFFSQHHIREDKFHIGMLGRIEHGKGQHFLIEAIAMLKQQGIEVHAMIIGHVMDEQYLEGLKTTIARNQLEHQISMVDFIEQPMKVMPCFDCIVLTTFEETFGLVLVEAMRCGVSVIGSAAGGVLEIIDDNKSGLLFKPADANDLARCIRQLVEDPQFRQKLAIAGKQKADQHFSETRHFDDLADILRDFTSQTEYN
jgi:glycosyltransferase involved in cell wall biosynthesis